MSNLELAPPEVECGEDARVSALEVIAPRDVPLGGPRAMRVRRTLPTRERTMIGAWCFADHYGPDEVDRTGGMNVPPHPHTGLQTVSWLFSGEVEHRDSTGVQTIVRPGELNLMTSGRGISHSEVSTPQTRTLHGVQLWTALPEESRFLEPGFEHYAPEPTELDRGRLSVFIGSLVVDSPTARRTVSSPVRTYSPLLGAELTLQPEAAVTVGLDPAFEHGVLVDAGPVHLGPTDAGPTGAGPMNSVPEKVAAHDLAYLAPGRETLELRAGEQGGRMIILGGTPFGEQIVMWWNFIGRDHDEIVAARDLWQARVEQDAETPFGSFDFPGDPLPAPPLPGVRLRPRG